MPFHDLNVSYASNDAELSNTLAFLLELEYTIVALAVSVTSKLPSQLLRVSTSQLKVPSNLTLLSRLTLTISDTSQNHRINQLVTSYDLLALRPTNDKAFQLCCATLDCDLISLDFTQRVPFPIKFKTVASALQRGIRFEICYSAGITGGNDARRNLISGAAALIRATRGRGIILSSEARNTLDVRGPWDVINLAQIWGLSQERGKEAICEEAGKVVRLARVKRTSFRGVVDVLNDGSTEVEVPKESISTTAPEANVVLPNNEKPTEELPPLRQVTVVPEKKVSAQYADQAKRKASSASLREQNSALKDGTKPISKREMKRQAKKAKLDRVAGMTEHSEPKGKEKSNGFPFQHDTL